MTGLLFLVSLALARMKIADVLFTLRFWLIGIFVFVPFTASAGDMYMAPGESQVIQVKGNIDTIFVSAQSVADYEVIGEHGIMIYAKADGQADVAAFDSHGNQLIKITLRVDTLISALQKKITQIAPGSQVTLEKIGKSYVISGTVASEDDRDKIYQIVGEGVGAERQTEKKEVKEVGDDQSSNKKSYSWLDEIIYKNVINRLRLPLTNQVNVKLSVVEVTKTFSENVGIDWSSIGQATGSFHFIKLNADTLNSMVHAISNDSIARVLAEPNLSVISGETAEFLVGGEVPLVTSSINGTNVSYKDFGIKLNIGAKVNTRQSIRISLGEEVSNLNDTFSTVAGDSFPAFQTRRARTTVELADGESFLLGGLISNEERESLSRIPLIGDVPILGAFFRNASTERDRKELIVVATVKLVKPLASHDIVVPYFQRTTTWARFLNFAEIGTLRDRRMAESFIEQGGFIK